MSMSEDGKRLHVVNVGNGSVYVYVGGPKAQAWADSTNPEHLVTLSRLLLGETHTGRRIRFKDYNTFNLCRDNMETEVKATKERFPIDWTKAEERRAIQLGRAEKAIEGRTAHSGSILTH